MKNLKKLIHIRHIGNKSVMKKIIKKIMLENPSHQDKYLFLFETLI